MERLAKFLLKLASNLITVALGIIMACTIYMAISSRLDGQPPTIFGLQMYEVLSGSMEPGIHTGSVIFDKRHVDTSSLKKGDVITFRAPATGFTSEQGSVLVTHRIFKVIQHQGITSFQTKGDANPTPDPWTIPASNVVAQYDNFTIPYVGYFLTFLKSKLGIGLLLISPGALLILASMWSIAREVIRLQKQNAQDASGQVETSTDSVRV